MAMAGSENPAPVRSPGYSDMESLRLSSLLNLHLSLFAGVFRPIDALDRTQSEFATADQLRYALPGLPPMVMLNTARAVKAVFTAPPYSFGTSSDVGASLLGTETFFAIDGAKHQQHRRLIMPHFHGQCLHAYGSGIAGITREILAEWVPDRVFPIHTSFQEITLRSMLRILLGSSARERFDPMQSAFRAILNAPLLAACIFFKPLQVDLGPWSPWGRLLRLKRQLSELLLAEIADRRAREPGNDVLGLLLPARDEEGESLTDAEIRDEIMAMMFAANEATAAALAWSVYWVHRDARVRERLLAELAGAGAEPEPMEIAKLPYLSAVCQETLRISPVTLFAIPRATKQSFHLFGYDIEPGVLLAPCIYLVHRDPEVYPGPEVFKPERFVNRQYSSYEFLPFGGSNRRCVGAGLALFEMKIVLATLLRTMQVCLAGESPTRPQRHGTTFIPSGGLPVTARVRPDSRF